MSIGRAYGRGTAPGNTGRAMSSKNSDNAKPAGVTALPSDSPSIVSFIIATADPSFFGLSEAFRKPRPVRGLCFLGAAQTIRVVCLLLGLT